MTLPGWYTVAGVWFVSVVALPAITRAVQLADSGSDSSTTPLAQSSPTTSRPSGNHASPSLARNRTSAHGPVGR